MSMIDRLRLRRRASSSSGVAEPTSSTLPPSAPPSRTFTHSRKPMPYEVPDPQGRCFFLDLPEELLGKVFMRLDRTSLARCHRICRSIADLLSTNSDLSLHHLLQSNSLRLNPHALRPSSVISQVPPSRAQLLSTLRERLTRFRNFTPKSTTRVKFEEREGRLYEYLEGVLLRNVSKDRRERGREAAIYDLSKLNDWEDLPQSAVGGSGGKAVEEDQEMEEEQVEVLETEGEGEEYSADVRRLQRFDFEILDFAVDPGMDLFVLAEQRRDTTARNYSMHFHLLTLSTFEPHPRATQPELKWPVNLTHRDTSLGFQICDDGLYVLRNNSRGAAPDHLVGWQWTTGRLAVTLKAPAVTTFESFILLTPSSFLIPSVATKIRTDSTFQDNLADPRDLEFTLHLQLFAFPPFSAVPFTPGQVVAPPPHTAVHIATIDLPEFVVDFEMDLPPPRMTVRTDPPPRHTYPTHPAQAPPPFVTDPESGVIVLEFNCQPFGPTTQQAHFVLFTLKTTLLSYLPAPTSPLLFQAFPRPAPVVRWETIAPKVRMIGPDQPEPSWVCYVYQYRYVTPLWEALVGTQLRLYDFDPLRVRKELYDRRNEGFIAPETPRRRRPSASISSPLRSFFGSSPDIDVNHPQDGDRDGIYLTTSETVLPKRAHLAHEVRTGSELPFTYVEKRWENQVDTVVIDAERIVAFDSQGDGEAMEVMEF